MKPAKNNVYRKSPNMTGRAGDLKCRCCGKTSHLKANCRMKEEVCFQCGKVGHIAAVCEAGSGGSAADAAGGAGRKKDVARDVECMCCGTMGHKKV